MVVLAIGSSCILAGSSAVGILVGLIGRFSCLDAPAEFPEALARIRMAVILELCGLLSGVVNLGVGWAVTTWSVELPGEVWSAVFLFAIALFVAGRAFFYAFTVALAKVVDVKPALQPEAAYVILVVTSSTIVASAVALQLTGGSRSITLTEVLIAGGTFVAALGTFGTLYAIGRGYRRLREAVTQFNTRPVGHVEG